MRVMTIDLEQRHITCSALIPRYRAQSNTEALKEAERYVAHSMSGQFAQFLAASETEYDIMRQSVKVRADFIVLTPDEFHALTQGRFAGRKRIEIPDPRGYHAVFHMDGSPPSFGEEWPR